MANAIQRKMQQLDRELTAMGPGCYKDFDGCLQEIPMGSDYFDKMDEWRKLKELCYIREVSDDDVVEMVMGCCLADESQNLNHFLGLSE